MIEVWTVMPALCSAFKTSFGIKKIAVEIRNSLCGEEI
jgi:hypothetical protein